MAVYWHTMSYTTDESELYASCGVSNSEYLLVSVAINNHVGEKGNTSSV
jgi:hypothetical protein